MSDDLILKKLDLMAKEFEFLRDTSVLFAKRQARFDADINEMRDEIRQLADKILKPLHAMQSEIVLLENQNISRHTEILQILQRIDERESV